MLGIVVHFPLRALQSAFLDPRMKGNWAKFVRLDAILGHQLSRRGFIGGLLMIFLGPHRNFLHALIEAAGFFPTKP